MKKLTISAAAIILGIALSLVPATQAATNCSFTTVDMIMVLDSDCTTDATIFIPNEWTLNGNDFTITAVDPAGGHFTGAVVANGGPVANVEHLSITTSALGNVCDAGANRLRGIMFQAASGTIAHNRVLNINQGPSGCQEGNAIEIRNDPMDGTHPNTQHVTVFGNKIEGYQKTGIVANGDVAVDIQNNQIGSSATQANLAANSVQLGFGGTGIVMNNNIDGNSWCGPSNYVATAVLVLGGTRKH
ncbi:MAG: hypothetical protein HY695_33070 [Deltaproteobacteria bacterium]|nr:hypothetical protein [Deltaproteobacteria bacterium]